MPCGSQLAEQNAAEHNTFYPRMPLRHATRAITPARLCDKDMRVVSSLTTSVFVPEARPVAGLRPPYKRERPVGGRICMCAAPGTLSFGAGGGASAAGRHALDLLCRRRPRRNRRKLGLLYRARRLAASHMARSPCTSCNSCLTRGMPTCHRMHRLVARAAASGLRCAHPVVTILGHTLRHATRQRRLARGRWGALGSGQPCRHGAAARRLLLLLLPRGPLLLYAASREPPLRRRRLEGGK